VAPALLYSTVVMQSEPVPLVVKSASVTLVNFKLGQALNAKCAIGFAGGLYCTVRYHLFHGSFCVCGAGDCFCVCEPELRTALTTRMVPMRLGLVLLCFTVVSVFAEQEVLSAVNTDSSKMASKRSKLRSTQCEENVDVDSLWVTAFGGAPGGGILRDPLVNSGHVSLSRKRFDDSTALTAPMYGFSGDGEAK
jgi:hypothetical protein